MKNWLTYSFVLIISMQFLSAQSLEIDLQTFDYKTDDYTYTQVNTYYLGATMPYEVVDSNTYSVKLISTLLLKQNDTIINAEKHRLESTSDNRTDFTDTYRLKTEPGKYNAELIVKKEGSDSTIYHRKQEIEVKSIHSPGLSDIMLLQSFKKGNEETMKLRGVNVEILPFTFIADALDKLSYFVEYYPDRKQDEKLYFLERVEKYKNKKWVEYSKTVDPLGKRNNIMPFFKAVDISKLESGEYRLITEVINRDRDVLASANVFFVRSNPDMDIKKQKEEFKGKEKNTFVEDLTKEELVYNLKAIAPVIPQNEVSVLNFVLDERTETGMRAFLYNYWKKRAPINTEIQYENYMEVARAVDQEYQNGMGHGFETDRGRVFLKYGRPTQIITSEQEIASVPYEIWTYDQISQTNQANVKFVFYNPDLITNGFELLHSTARGEVTNPRWETFIYSGAPNQIDGKNFLDSRGMEDNINRNARRNYEEN